MTLKEFVCVCVCLLSAVFKQMVLFVFSQLAAGVTVLVSLIKNVQSQTFLLR